MSQNPGTPWSTSGTPQDLEAFSYRRHEFAVLPDPPGVIPFHQQGLPIFNPQHHTVESEQIVQATTITQFNPIPYQRWIGNTQVQHHVPQFLSVNETFVPAQ